MRTGHRLEMGGRYRAGLPMTDRSSCPWRSPSRCSRRLERRIVGLRFARRWGSHRIAYHLGIPRSTVGRVLARYRMPLLANRDQATGLCVRAPKPTRCQAAGPGELVHVDINVSEADFAQTGRPAPAMTVQSPSERK